MRKKKGNFGKTKGMGGGGFKRREEKLAKWKGFGNSLEVWRKR